MKRINQNQILVLVLGFLLISTTGCPRKKPAVITPPDMPGFTEVPTPKTEETPQFEVTESTEIVPEPPLEDIPETEWKPIPELDIIYFDYDKSDLSEKSKRSLEKNADWLVNNSAYQVVVEGHCCECGSIEYNLGLAQRRAATVRDYYMKLGVDGRRVATISYGEEKPALPGVCPQDDATLGIKNRRAITKIREVK